MKKFLSLALVLVLVLTMLTSCDFFNKIFNKEAEDTPAAPAAPAPTPDIDKAAAAFDIRIFRSVWRTTATAHRNACI